MKDLNQKQIGEEYRCIPEIIDIIRVVEKPKQDEKSDGSKQTE